MKGKHLITTSEWFIAPDGKYYKAVFGDCEVVDAPGTLGIETNRNSSNWYVKVKGQEDEMIVAGCQIHYVVKTEKVNPDRKVIDIKLLDSGQTIEYKTYNRIYIVE